MKTVVGFLSRSHGYDVLTKLIESKEFKIIQIFTHKLNPLSQDTSRSIRDDYTQFEKICVENKIPLSSIDFKNMEIPEFPECDFIVEVSWRYIIPQNIVKKAKFLSFGIHRGKLPDYAGGEPIKQALKNNDKEIILSAHLLDSVIDAGKTIATKIHPVNYDDNYDLENNIKRLRGEIHPLFGQLTLEVLHSFYTNN
jgi:methionyl-tRNA formyltransferase